MKSLKLLISILMIFVTSCSKNETIKSNCKESTLEEFNMVEYNDQEIDCKFFLELFHHEKKEFFLLGNHCADMISYPTDCNGNTLCENGEDSECRKFYKSATRIGIIGIRE